MTKDEFNKIENLLNKWSKKASNEPVTLYPNKIDIFIRDIENLIKGFKHND